MPARPALIAILSGGLMLMACQSEAQQRASLIEQGVNSCLEGFNKSAGAVQSGIDGRRVCTCSVNRMTEGKSLSEVKEISQRDNPTSEDMQAMMSCVQEAGAAGPTAK